MADSLIKERIARLHVDPEGAEFFGVPLTELDRDDLLRLAAWQEWRWEKTVMAHAQERKILKRGA